jgi:uncharacterized damage-inducible protein DinB
MPNISERQALLHEINHMLKAMAMFDDEETEEFEELLEVKTLLEETTYMNLRKYQKCRFQANY